MKTTWRLYPPPVSPHAFKAGDTVFIRTKSAKEIGRKGVVVRVGVKQAETRISCGQSNKRRKRAKEEDAYGRIVVKIPCRSEDARFYEASFRPSRLILVVCSDRGQSTPHVVITATTSQYRLLAASQILPTDNVLEIGCSTGECSRVISRYANSLVGLDVAQVMVDAARKNCIVRPRSKTEGPPEREQECEVHIYKVDAFLDPVKARELATKKMESSSEEETRDISTVSVVFIDIGGNREDDPVVKMIHWARNTFSPRLIVVKSEELVKKIDILAEGKGDENIIHSADSNGIIHEGDAWFDSLRMAIKEKSNQARPCPSSSCISYARDNLDLQKFIPPPHYDHPLKAPLSVSPSDGATPICRYENYDEMGCKKAERCQYDHYHCHWCHEPGHTALKCPGRPKV